jgi:hypothetical protein
MLAQSLITPLHGRRSMCFKVLLVDYGEKGTITSIREDLHR